MDDLESIAKKYGLQRKGSQPSPVQTPNPVSDLSSLKARYEQSLPPVTTPNVVSPFTQETPVTQTFDNYNPGMGYYNDTHKGTDFGTTSGTPINLPVGGKIKSIGYDPVYGNSIEILGQSPEEFGQGDNPEGQVVKISHNQPLPSNWKEGEYIATGSAGIKTGNSGSSTGDHTDFETFKLKNRGNYANYEDFLQFLKDKTK